MIDCMGNDYERHFKVLNRLILKEVDLEKDRANKTRVC